MPDILEIYFRYRQWVNGKSHTSLLQNHRYLQRLRKNPSTINQSGDFTVHSSDIIANLCKRQGPHSKGFCWNWSESQLRSSDIQVLGKQMACKEESFTFNKRQTTTWCICISWKNSLANHWVIHPESCVSQVLYKHMAQLNDRHNMFPTQKQKDHIVMVMKWI